MNNFIELWRAMFSGLAAQVKKLAPEAREAGRRDMTLLLDEYQAGGQEVLTERFPGMVVGFVGETEPEKPAQKRVTGRRAGKK